MTFEGQLDTGKVSSRPCRCNDIGFIPVAVLVKPQSAVQNCVLSLRSPGDLWRSTGHGESKFTSVRVQ